MSKNSLKFACAALIAAIALARLVASEAHANLPKWGNGVVLVPPAKFAQPALAAPSRAASPALAKDEPRFKRGKVVDFASTYKTGSIVVVSSEHALYLVLGNVKAVKYRVATGKRGFEWAGSHQVSSKVKWPEWTPPEEMRKRRPELPAHMEGGVENPLGARAIYLGSSLYRIHGTNEPKSIGRSASSGCIRMLNADVIELFNNVKLGATVVVI